MEQKFKRGNLVRLLNGHDIISNGEIIDISPEQVGKLAIIQYSYAEKYGGSDVNSYSIMFQDTGSTLAWRRTNEMELVDIGGEHLFEEPNKRAAEFYSKATNLTEIVKSWVDKKDKQPPATILYLFEKVGFKTRFHTTGEFFVLAMEWDSLYRLFDAIITGTEDDVRNVFRKDSPPEYIVGAVDLWKEVQGIKKK